MTNPYMTYRQNRQNPFFYSFVSSVSTPYRDNYYFTEVNYD